MTEHRKSQRFELRLPLEVVRSGNHATSLHGHTLNLSSSGVLFEADVPPEIGEIIEYYITFPTTPTTESGVHLRCMGKVLRTHDRFAAATMERYEFVRQRPALSIESPLATEAAAG